VPTAHILLDDLEYTTLTIADLMGRLGQGDHT
jgi:hypothetical protein